MAKGLSTMGDQHSRIELQQAPHALLKDLQTWSQQVHIPLQIVHGSLKNSPHPLQM